MRVQNQPQQNRVVHEIIASDIPKDKKIAMTLQAATLSNKKEPNHGFQIFLPTIWAAGPRFLSGGAVLFQGRPFAKLSGPLPEGVSMSALPPKADIRWLCRYVRFVPKADKTATQ